MEFEQLQRAIEAILFAAGERIEIRRLADVLETEVGNEYWPYPVYSDLLFRV